MSEYTELHNRIRALELASRRPYDTGWINRSDWTNVHLGSNATKNTDSNVTHNLNAPLSCLLVNVFISTDGTDANSFEPYCILEWNASTPWAYGYTISQVDNNNLCVQTGTHGLLHHNTNGTYNAICTQDWYYKIKTWYLG